MVSSSTKRFEGKVVLVTGGTSGIGLAMAEAFLAEGASVAVCGLTADKARDFQARHRGTLALSGDIADPTFQMALLGSVGGRFGRLDILVNNAGKLVERDFVDHPPGPDAIAAEFHLNLLAPVQLTSQALSRWSCLEALVFVSSGYALVSPRRAPTYGAAKAGLHGFADGLRRQLEPRGIHVLEVLPPVVDTAATAHRDVRKVSPETVAAATLDALAARRPMALVGATRILPALLRLAPETAKRLVSKT